MDWLEKEKKCLLLFDAVCMHDTFFVFEAFVATDVDCGAVDWGVVLWLSREEVTNLLKIAFSQAQHLQLGSDSWDSLFTGTELVSWLYGGHLKETSVTLTFGLGHSKFEPVLQGGCCQIFVYMPI
jgi:hypothetical protein